MKSFINEYGQPVIEVAIKGSSGEIFTEAVIDTGFDGEVCLPVQIAIQLGLLLRGDLQIELADGTVKSELVFGGSITWQNKEKEIRIILTNSQQTLIGTSLLQDRILKIDFRNKVVEVV